MSVIAVTLSASVSVRYSSMTELHVKANNSKSYDFTAAAPEKNAMTVPLLALLPSRRRLDCAM